MRLLLHTCCAPCAIAVLKLAREDKYDSITGFFYNPNIHPGREFTKREDYAMNLFKSEQSDFIGSSYKPEEYFDKIRGFENTKIRCPACWDIRLRKTASFAKEKRFDAFTTTLLASPHQDHESLKRISESLGKTLSIKFYYKDFRNIFREAYDQARLRGIYCQNYCGCVFSIVEREDRRKKRVCEIKHSL